MLSVAYDLGPYIGIAGTIDLIGTGDPERNLVVVQFENGDIRFHKRILPDSRQGQGVQGEL